MTKTQMPAAATVEKIAQELATAVEPLTIAALANRVGLSPTTVRKAVTALTEAGRINKDDDNRLRYVHDPVTKAAAEQVKAKPATAKKAAPKPKSDKKAKMLDTMAERDRAAVELIRRAGVQGISVDDLSKALGVSNGAGRTVRARLSEHRSPGTDVEIESAGGGKWRIAAKPAKTTKKAAAKS